jgi:hypothetical protein
MDWVNSALEFLKSPAGLALLAVAATLVAKKYPAIGALIMAWVKSKTPDVSKERTQVLDAVVQVQHAVAVGPVEGREDNLKVCDQFKCLAGACFHDHKEAAK